jgi:hypothetical protein
MRGRPHKKTYLLARQIDLFADEAFTAQLEKKYPYLASMKLTTQLSISARSAAGAADRDAARSEASTAPRSGAPLPPITNRGGKSEGSFKECLDLGFYSELISRG